MVNLKRLDIELFCWVGGLAGLAFSNPTQTHWSICPLKNLGFRYCPGCGLGRSISFLFHGEVLKSLQTHPLGIFALTLLLHRIFVLSKRQFFPSLT
ncbi:MAG TPA: DUF2752 domain-containing protein [Chitinophagaceae bacterium]|nr:DUF2752 domain-containing protein [Chitinophagaceae bacterium]